MLTLDHLKLIDGDPAEMKKLRTFIMGTQAGDVTETVIMHEADGSCCQREPWNATLARIVLAVRGPTPILAVNNNRPGSNP
jgi:hypothetical protein